MRHRLSKLATVLAVWAMSGCVWHSTSSVATAPPEPVAAPMATGGSIFSSANHLLLFDDPIAHNVGDILTVLLVERTDATKSASTSTSKDTSVSTGNPTLFGLPVTHNGVPLLNNSIESTNAFSGEGASTQSNRLAGSVSVRVDERLANGNLRVSGSKVIELNQGSEVVSIVGIVRPADIGPDNIINSDRIAESEIRYAGRGELNRANRMGPLARIFNSPFRLLDAIVP